jgi:hypothetical protein
MSSNWVFGALLALCLGQLCVCVCVSPVVFVSHCAVTMFRAMVYIICFFILQLPNYLVLSAMFRTAICTCTFYYLCKGLRLYEVCLQYPPVTCGTLPFSA